LSTKPSDFPCRFVLQTQAVDVRGNLSTKELIFERREGHV
jgi:hypothetical protein